MTKRILLTKEDFAIFFRNVDRLTRWQRAEVMRTNRRATNHDILIFQRCLEDYFEVPA